MLGALDRLEPGQVSDMLLTEDKGFFVYVKERKLPDLAETNPQYAATRAQLARLTAGLTRISCLSEIVVPRTEEERAGRFRRDPMNRRARPQPLIPFRCRRSKNLQRRVGKRDSLGCRHAAFLASRLSATIRPHAPASARSASRRHSKYPFKSAFTRNLPRFSRRLKSEAGLVSTSWSPSTGGWVRNILNLCPCPLCS